MIDIHNEILKTIQNIIQYKSIAGLSLGREMFSTRLLQFNARKGILYTDIVIPKDGNEYLESQASYSLNAEYFSSGLIRSLRFNAQFRRRINLNNMPALEFLVEDKISSEIRHCEIATRKDDKVIVEFNYDKINVSEKVLLLGVQAIIFNSTSPALALLKNNQIRNIRLILPDHSLVFDATISRHTRHSFKLSSNLKGYDGFAELNHYISDCYQEEIERLTTKVKNGDRVRPAVLVKPIQELPKYKAKIMIIDDEKMVTELISRILMKLVP